MKELSTCKILLVDDTKTNIHILVQALKDDYELGVAMNGHKAIEYAVRHKPDLILLDILMPEMDGFEVCERLSENQHSKDIPIIFITAMDDPKDKTRGFEMGAVDYITKPFDITEVKSRVKTHLTLKVSQEALEKQNIILNEKVRERTRNLEETQIEIINRLGLAAEFRDEGTGNHVKRMSRYCNILGKAYGLPVEEYRILALASTMHDIGKIGISDSILLKNGKLTDEEWIQMKLHPAIGARLLSGSKSKLLKKAEIIALTHHEWWDGTGYPSGLKGEEIPLIGRITCICDVFDALSSERPYKKAWSVEKAAEEIKINSGKHFDPKLVKLFIALLPEIRKIIHEFK